MRRRGREGRTGRRRGLTAADREVGELLRRKNKDVILVANKIDTQKLPDDFYDFYELGLGDPIGISSVNMLGFGDLLDQMVALFPAGTNEEENEGGEKRERDAMREKPGCQDLQKHLKKGRRICWKKGKRKVM